MAQYGNGKSYLEQPELQVPQAPYRSASLLQPNNFKKQLKAAVDDPSKIMFGIAQGIPSVYATKILATTKPDLIWIDAEHPQFNRETLADAVQACQTCSEGHTSAIVRVPEHDDVILSTALDAGAAALIIPHVETVEGLRVKIEQMYYAPIGKRSWSPWHCVIGVTNSSLYPNDVLNTKNSNNHIGLIAQIESVKGLENVDAIAAIPEVDALMIGPMDYSIDAGIETTPDGKASPRLIEALGKMAQASAKSGKPLFGCPPNKEQLEMMLQGGWKMLCLSMDQWILANQATSLVADARKVAIEVLGSKKDGS